MNERKKRERRKGRTMKERKKREGKENEWKEKESKKKMTTRIEVLSQTTKIPSCLSHLEEEEEGEEDYNNFEDKNG